MIKVGIQAYRNSGHQMRGVGVYGNRLVAALKRVKNLKPIEFSTVNELINKEIDLVHFLHFDLFQRTLPTHLRIPTVLTIHDVTPLVFPKHYPPGIKGRINLFLQKKALKKINHIVTVSNASKKDLINYLGIPESKITVIYSGINEQFKKITNYALLNTVKDKYKLPDQFGFYSGNVNWNKNIIGMTEACISAGLDLVIVGKSFEDKGNINHPEMKSYKEFLTKFANHPKVHILGFVPVEDMVTILNQATVALFVSFYEGFGFPILEAQACGVPVITSKISSMPEIGGDGALYVDPYSITEMTNAIKKMLVDNQLRKELIIEGNKNVSRFSWKKCAEETAAVYAQLVP